MSGVIHAGDDTFDKAVLQSDVPVLVDFWAAWCGPCKAIAPILDEMAQEYDGKARIVKVDVDENRELATQYGIRSIPALMVFKNGEKVDATMGMQPKAQLASMLDKHL